MEGGAEDLSSNGAAWVVTSGAGGPGIGAPGAGRRGDCPRVGGPHPGADHDGPGADEPEAKKVLRLLEAIDDHDDVQAVHSNADISDEVLATFEGSTPGGPPAPGRHRPSASASASPPAILRTHVRLGYPPSAVPRRLRPGGPRRGVRLPGEAGPPVCSKPTPDEALAQRLLVLQTGSRGLITELRPDVVAVERVFFQVMRGPPCRWARPAGWRWSLRPGRVRGGPVHLQRGQAGAGRLRRAHQAADPADGGPGAGAASVEGAARRRRRAAPAVCHLTPCPLRRAVTAAASSREGSLR